MSIGDIGLMNALKTRMQWQQARQRVLAENVANADTPGYRAKDLEAPQMPVAAGDRAAGAPRAPVVALAVTESGHMAGSGGTGDFKSADRPQFEIKPSGNAVDLEDQMTKSAENQLDYQTVATLYQQALGLIRTAVGK